MPILSVAPLPVITIDDLRQLACSLEKASRQQLLRCLKDLPRTRVLRWDEQPPIVTEMVIAVPGRRWRLRYDEAYGWSLRESSRKRSSVPNVRPTDVVAEYRALRTLLSEIKKQLSAQRSSGRRAPAQVSTARIELARATAAWPPGMGRWEIEGGHVVIRVSQGIWPTDVTWQDFLRGQFGPAAVAKQLLARRVDCSVPSLQRTLNLVSRHYREQRAARNQKRRQI